MSRDCLTITDFTVDEVRQILALARVDPPDLGRPLDGQGVPLIFEKPSNRTRQSMEMATVELGGHPVYTRGEEVGFDEREPVEDIAHIMDGYHAMLAARVFAHNTVVRLAEASERPVINMLSDYAHPLQGFADALTMETHLGDLAGRTVAYVGDYNNVSRSLAEISLLLGANVTFGCPPGFDAAPEELNRLAALGVGTVSQSANPREAVSGADAVHTDTWVSMGQEEEKEERRRIFDGFGVGTEMMSLAADGAIFMHCLPAYRGFEVTAEVIDGPQSVVYEQGHNRLHSARGLMAFLMGVRP